MLYQTLEDVASCALRFFFSYILKPISFYYNHHCKPHVRLNIYTPNNFMSCSVVLIGSVQPLSQKLFFKTSFQDSWEFLVIIEQGNHVLVILRHCGNGDFDHCGCDIHSLCNCMVCLPTSRLACCSSKRAGENGEILPFHEVETLLAHIQYS